MKKEYYIDRNTENKNYGMYDWIDEAIKTESNVKTFGALYDNKYIFRTYIDDHYKENEKIKETIGPFNFLVSTHHQINDTEVFIYARGNPKPNDFAYETAINILKECIKYRDEHGIKILIDVSNLLGASNIKNFDIESEIGRIKKAYDLFIEEQNEKDTEVIKETKEDKIKIFDIKKIISMFKKDKFKKRK